MDPVVQTTAPLHRSLCLAAVLSRGGIIGEQPSLTDLAPGGNLKHGIDFRGLYSSILRDWFGLSEDDVLDVMGGEFYSTSYH